jgi:hypothetical protein
MHQPLCAAAIQQAVLGQVLTVMEQLVELLGVMAIDE